MSGNITMPDNVPEVPPAHDLDLADVPVESLAAYWLSLVRLATERGGAKALATEAEAVEERYIRHLVGLAAGGGDEKLLLRLAGHRREVVLAGYRRALACMRLASISAAGNERPRQTLIAMLALYPVRTLPETRLAQLAKELYQAIASGQRDALNHMAVRSGDAPEKLLVKLLTCVLVSRKDGPEGLRVLLPRMCSIAMHEGLSLASDGFSPAFVGTHLCDLNKELLVDTGLKMDLCDEMALGLASGQPYDVLFKRAQVFLQ